jgi:carboxymethylenebutenolidase
MKSTLLFVALLFFASSASAQGNATDPMKNSPRHHEWVTIPSDGRNLYGFVAYPEKSQKTLAVIVIHENLGLTDWVKGFADRLAAAGYIAIAPDLLSSVDPTHGRTADFKTPDDARYAITRLDPDRITRDLLAVRNYITRVPSSSGQTAVIGFCWGGMQSFRFATRSTDISAALVFYGTPPETEEDIRRITAPVYGFYGGNDARVGATIPGTRDRMKKYGKAYEYEIYDGAGHAFMRLGEDPKGSPENRKAREKSWVRLKEILSRIQSAGK